MTHAPHTRETAPEMKSGDAEIAQAFDIFRRTFEAFKADNDDRIAEIERKMSADVVTVEKVDRINRALDEQKRAVDQLMLKNRRPALGATETPSLAAIEHKAAFEAYVRGGDDDGLKRIEQKSLSVGVAADGGYLVPEETEREIGRRLTAASPIRAIAGIRQMSANVYKKPFAITGPATGWVGETDARTETDSPTLAELQFPAMELYAMPAATATLLDDSAVNIDEWIASEVETAFAEQEGTAFVTGDGSNKPKGFLDYTTVAEASWVWGQLGYVATGVDGDWPASNESDILVDLVYALKAGYRQNAHWVMNRRTQAAIRKLKDADGNYIWRRIPDAVAMSGLVYDPGWLRQRVTIESAAATPDGAGGETVTWNPVAMLWARINPTRADERAVAGHRSGVVTHLVTLRWRDDIAGGMRVGYRGRTFRILSVHDPDETRRYLVAKCEEEAQ